jgi:hypothetical protein
MRATGGGGSAGFQGPTGAPSIFTTSLPVPLVATIPLEKDSTHDFAESGDTATGWFAMATEALQNGPNQPPYVEVTVWAVCVDDDQGPPEDEDD